MSDPLEELTVILTTHHLVMAKLRERISVSKQARHKFDVERFDLKKLNDVDVKEKYQVEISNTLANLESLDESFDINNPKDNVGYHWLNYNGCKIQVK
jgi:hypothetical protein